MEQVKGTKINRHFAAKRKSSAFRWLLGLIGVTMLGGQATAQTVIRPVAVTQRASMKAYNLDLMLPDGSNRVRLYTSNILGEPSFSPTDSKVVVRDNSCRCMLIITYTETATAAKVTGTTRIPVGEGDGGDFSPDGKHILYSYVERTADGSTRPSVMLYTLADGATPASTRTLITGQYGYSYAWVSANRFLYTGRLGQDSGHYLFDVRLNADGTVSSQSIAQANNFTGISKARTRNSAFVGIDAGNNNRTAHELDLDTFRLSEPIVLGSAEKPVPSPNDQSLIYRETGSFVLKRRDFASGATFTIDKRNPMAHDWRP